MEQAFEERMLELPVEAEDVGSRLDIFLAAKGVCTRSAAQNLIKNGHVLLDDVQETTSSKKLKAGQSVTVELPEAKPLEAAPEDIPLDILYEDSDVIVINKPRGMVVHPAPGNETGTLVNALLFHCKDLSGINGVQRPGIVHRLDKDTTGALSVAKNDKAHESLALQISQRTMHRCYHAIVQGRFREQSGFVEANIGRHPVHRKKMAVVPDGRWALTNWRVLEEFEAPYTLLELRLKTGRTHQIRVHMAHIGHPVANDPLYAPNGKKLPALPAQALHAYELGFVHPTTGEDIMTHAPYPADFQKALDYLRAGGGK
ncbi:MAG: RluA family pseudouridine synthase [Clostridia bacterium]|nr:RluA family pseudouridine synthase [Clostridia bacterium]